MSEVEALADRMSIIRLGEIVASGTLTQFRQNAFATIRATTTRPLPHDAGVLGNARIEGHHVVASIRPDTVGETVSLLATAGIEDISVEPASLKSLFLSLYED